MIGNRPIRAISIAITIVMVFSAFFALTSLAEAPGSEPVVETPVPVVPETAENVAIEAAKATAGPLVGLNREGVRAWAEKIGVPSARLAVPSAEMTSFLEIEESGGVFTPSDANEVAMHNSDLAHGLGFDGTDVVVAVIDTGLDFAHPDLYNVTYRVLDTGSDYFLHPMAYDGASLNDYLVFGDVGPNSWWVNTTYSTTVVEFNMTRWVNWTDGMTNLSWNVTGVAGLSAGEEVRIGFHPDDKLNILLGMRAGVVLFNDAGAGGPYDSVLSDLDGDFNLSDEKRAWINTDWPSFDANAELLFQDLDGDGVQDVSGGMLTFISDGVREIPYADRQIDVLNLTMQSQQNDNSFDIWAGLDPASHLVPGMGDLTILFGDFDGPGTPGSHGTWVASAIGGQAMTGGFGGGPTLLGHAPGAKIIGAGNNFGNADPFGQAGLWTAVMFAAEGYDGVPDTGDEAQIASNSWGGGDWTGWEWGSRFVDWVSTIHADERILYVFAAGNSGPGMGGRQGPAGGASLMTSGAMENYIYRVDPWYAFDGGPNPSYGGTAYFSNRGPSAMGRHYLDALTSGMFGYGADPLNNNPFTSDGGAVQDGNSSWFLWSGTSLSTPNLAGITALVYDAYEGAHFGLFPMASTAKGIVKQSADDAGQDPTLTGTGIANAFRAVLIANETDGVSIDVHEWNPGDYHGVDYAGYTNILPAGGADMATVTVTDHRPAAGPNMTIRDVTIEDAVLAQTGSVEFTFTRTPGTGTNLHLFNESGFMATNGTVLVPGSAALWGSADSIRVSAYIDIQRMIDDIPAFRLRLNDWTDVNANGSYEGFDERNLITQNFISWVNLNGPNTYMFLHDLDTMVHDGFAFQMESFLDPSTPIDITYVVDYFERMDWPWLSSSVPMVSLSPGSSAPVDLLVSVPADAKPGLYEAMYLFSFDGVVTTLPVMVNVASDGFPMEFGASSPGEYGHYQNGQTYGEWWGDDAGPSGDYRYYMLDLPEPATVTVIVEWNSPLSVHGLFLLTNMTDWFTENYGARYGPGTQDTLASTDVELLTTNGTAITATLNRGLSIVVLKAFHVQSMSVGETPKGQAGVIDLSPSDLTGVGVPVEGTQEFTVTSDLAFPDIQGLVETGSETTTFDIPIDPYSFPGGDFVQYLFDSTNRFQTVVASGVSRASYSMFFHSGARDADFGIFYDDDCDATYTVADDVIGSVASTSANPESAAVNNPAAGCYWVHAAGFDVDAGSLYDLTVTLVEQPFVEFTSLPSSIESGVPAEVTVDWTLPHISQTFAGTIFVGSAQFPRAIPIVVSLVPDLPPMLSGQSPADGAVLAGNTPTIGLDWQDTPDAFEGEVDQDSLSLIVDGTDLSSLAVTTATGMALNLPFALADGFHSVSVEVHDETGSQNRTAWSFSIDTTAPSLTITEPVISITNDPDVSVAGTTDPGVTVTVDGTPVSVGLTGTFRVDLTLADGTHSIPVISTDGAGNSASTTVDIIVDTVDPTISLSAPSSVEVASVEVTGSTEAGASVSVNGIAVDVDANGAFSVGLAVAPGSNTITAVATDAAGNSGSTSATVTFNDPVPGLQQDLDNANDGLNTAQGNLAGLQTQFLIAIVIAVIGIVLAAVLFVLYWGVRKGP